ncbi:hypothetical protein E3P91_01570 [Wallemia ichthyophaga]|nr:hypothetical protein E3P91_01570 [Wallemia ichthyophaga]
MSVIQNKLLDKWLKDDSSVVTARILSHATGEHINAAKNHLLHYYRNNTSLHPVIAITGRVGSGIQSQLIADLSTVQSSRSRYDEEHSIYVHALSPFKLADLTPILNYELEYFGDVINAREKVKQRDSKQEKQSKPVKQQEVKQPTKQPTKQNKPPQPAPPSNPPKKATNKRRVIESDEEEDLIISSPPEAPPPAQTNVQSDTQSKHTTQSNTNKTKKRKLTKSVTRMNEKGYMVTEDVDEWVSGGEDGEEGASIDAAPSEPNSNPNPNSNSKSKPKTAPKPPSKPPPPSKSTSKGQSSLNSFFMKK